MDQEPPQIPNSSELKPLRNEQEQQFRAFQDRLQTIKAKLQDKSITSLPVEFGALEADSDVVEQALYRDDSFEEAMRCLHDWQGLLFLKRSSRSSNVVRKIIAKNLKRIEKSLQAENHDRAQLGFSLMYDLSIDEGFQEQVSTLISQHSDVLKAGLADPVHSDFYTMWLYHSMTSNFLYDRKARDILSGYVVDPSHTNRFLILRRLLNKRGDPKVSVVFDEAYDRMYSSMVSEAEMKGFTTEAEAQSQI